MVTRVLGIVGTRGSGSVVETVSLILRDAEQRGKLLTVREVLADQEDNAIDALLFRSARAARRWIDARAGTQSHPSAVAPITALAPPASSNDVFELVHRGLHVFLGDPQMARLFVDLMFEPGRRTDLLRHIARSLLGTLGLSEAQRLVRFELVREALRATQGNRHAAARLLNVDRRYVLKMISEEPSIDPRGVPSQAK